MGHTAGLVDTQKAFINGLIDKDLSIDLGEIQDEWCTRFLQTAPVPSKSTICRVLKAKGLTRKVLEHRAIERDEILRGAYRDMIRMLPGHHRFVFMDEAHFDNRNMRRHRGRAYRGQPAVIMRKLGRQSNTSLLAAVTPGRPGPVCQRHQLCLWSLLAALRWSAVYHLSQVRGKGHVGRRRAPARRRRARRVLGSRALRVRRVPVGVHPARFRRRLARKRLRALN